MKSLCLWLVLLKAAGCGLISLHIDRVLIAAFDFRGRLCFPRVTRELRKLQEELSSCRV
jgi:hypothetical protein